MSTAIRKRAAGRGTRPRVGVTERVVDARQQLGAPGLEQPGQQRLAIREVVVERADGDARQRGDLAHVRGVQALVGEHLLGGAEDRLRRGLADALSQGPVEQVIS